MEYTGGTYISQVNANSPITAMKQWLIELKTEEIENFTVQDKKNLLNENFKDEDPILLSGKKNVWHFLVFTRKGTGYVNFVKTTRQ